MRRLPGLAAAFVFILAACAAEAPAGRGPSSAPSSAPPSAPPSAPVASASGSAGTTDAAIVRVRAGSTFETVAVDALSGAILARLPDGPLSPDGRSLFAARPAAGDTQVQALDPVTGAAIDYRTVAGRWALPVIGADRTPIGLSSDGSGLVLAAIDPPAGHSTFAVLPADLTSDPTVIELSGDFDVDGLSPGGTTLYLVERRDGRDYAIRSVDVRTGALDPTPVVDKREGEEAMVGSAVGRVVSSAWLHTLYLADEPFLHSLDASNKFTFCIELSRGIRDARELALAVSPDGGRAWVLDLSAGRVIAVDVSNGTASKPRTIGGLAASADLEPASTARTTALDPASTARTTALDPAVMTGDELVVATSRGLLSIDVAGDSARVLSSAAIAGVSRSKAGTVVALTQTGEVVAVGR